VVDLSVEDRLAIHELLALHGHLMDGGELERMGELFLADVVYDLNAVSKGVQVGVGELAASALALGANNPLGHHVTNVVIEEGSGDSARVRSKYLGVMRDGSVGSGVYEDALRKTAEGWRIAYRKVIPRREPLQP
jgi:3-phenylpropionate/cinnamic acid dioxygenase small subunit